MKSVYVAGHTGLVGSALVRRFSNRPELKLITASRAELDLLDARQVEAFLAKEQPEAVVVAAGRVGGIQANASKPAEFIYENLLIETNLIHGAWKAGILRLLNFGSACVYPKQCPQPMRPEYLMTGKMEPTSEPYATAKWAGMVLCSSYNHQYDTAYVNVIPATVYGPGDNFDPQDGHVISSLIRRFHEAVSRADKEIMLWGSGLAMREFIYSDDLAEACELVLNKYEAEEPLNIGVGESISIRDLAGMIADITRFKGAIAWDQTKPEGAPDKRLDSSRISKMNWKPKTKLREGLEKTYRWYLEHEAPAPLAASGGRS